VRLISARQVVLLCDNSYVYLFYHGQVYSRREEFGFEGIPTHKWERYCPILTLIDVDFGNREPRITSSSKIWPIQASSPNPIRWHSWSKQNAVAVLGMPLWSMGELMKGYVFNVFFSSTIDPGHVVR